MMNYIKPTAITALLISTLLLHHIGNAQERVTAFDQLVQVNEQWKNQQDANAALKTKVAVNLDEKELIQFHLQETEKLLRKRSTNHLSSGTRKSREANLNTLHAYWQRGVFPVNDKYANRQPYFIDKYNTYCAVGYLMQQSGADEIAREIMQTQNYSFLADLSHPGLMKWVVASGLTFDELALIQPGYSDPWPSDVIEMHYNNAGKDVNEYIEIHPYTGTRPIAIVDTVFFFNESGVLYKTLAVKQMQQFQAANRPFYSYTFPSGENFADKGTILLSGVDQYVSRPYIVQRIIYTDSTVEKQTFDGPPYTMPVTQKYSIGESENTPVGYSLNFCTSSLQSLPSTPGTLNSCIILPIGLSDFASKINNNKVDLIWETASEANNHYFEIERSSNGINFQSIGNVQGSGNSTSLKKYSFTDNTPGYINHYRLKQVDLDGKTTYSKILFVKMFTANPLMLIENVVKSTLQIQINTEQSNISTLSIFDFLGKQVLHLSCKSGNENINVSSLSAGKYLIRLYTKNGQVYNQQFIKQ